MLNNYLPIFQSRCINDISIEESNVNITAEMNPSLATLLSPKIGYLKAAEIAEEAMENNESVKNIVVKKGILSADEAEKLFDLKIISKNRFNE